MSKRRHSKNAPGKSPTSFYPNHGLLAFLLEECERSALSDAKHRCAIESSAVKNQQSVDGNQRDSTEINGTVPTCVHMSAPQIPETLYGTEVTSHFSSTP